MPRATVNLIELNQQLQPQAQPVDTYVKPAQSPLRGLADSLAVGDKALQDVLTTRDKVEEERQKTLGKAAFYQDGSGSFAKMVTDGNVPAQYSPYYVNGFKEAQGEAAGDNLRTKWQDAWDNWDGKDTDDPTAFPKFFHQFVAQNVGTQDPQVLKGILPSVQALQENATTQYTDYRHNRTVTGNLTTNGALINNGVQQGLDAGLTADKGADYPAIFNGVNQQVAKALANGDPGDKGADTFVDVMSAKILESHDPNLLKWFDTKVPGKDYTWGETPHGIEVKNRTLDSLETIAHQQEARLTAQQQAQAKQAREEAETNVVQSIINDPYAPFDEKWLTQGEKNGDPTIRVQASQWRDTLLKGVPSNPQDLQGFYSKVIAGEISPQAAIRDAMSHGVFRNVDDLKSAQQFVQSFQGQQSTIEKAQSSAGFRDVIDAIRTRTQAKDPTTFNPISGWSNEGFEASSDFRELVTRGIINNPNATPQELDEMVSKIGKQITDRIGLPPGKDAMLDAQQYERDPNLPFANPWAGNNAQDEGNQDVTDWEKAHNVGAQEKAIIQQQADRSGMSYDEYIRERALKKQPQAQPNAADPNAPAAGSASSLIHKTAYDPSDPDLGEGDQTNPVTPQQASQWIDQALNQQGIGVVDASGGRPAPDASPQTASLMGLIRHAEAANNYNAVWGNPDNKVDLGQYTVDQILGFQQAQRARGAASTAIGGYQFLYKTLRSLKSEMGLDGSEKFTPELQDKMGYALLNRRGLQAFRDGRISQRQFALSLSQEWAGLPNPNTGRSFYAGDGLNASTVGSQRVYAALGLPYTPRPIMASLDSPSAATGQQWAPPNPNAYANIPDTDSGGNAGQRAKFLEWNSDPVANNERNLNQLNPTMADVIRKAQSFSPVPFVVGSGKRTPEDQQKAVAWGWSKTNASDHLSGNAADLWPVDDKGAVSFDPAQQRQIAKAMKRAASELGVSLDVGADWKRFKDLPHFALKGTSA